MIEEIQKIDEQLFQFYPVCNILNTNRTQSWQGPSQTIQVASGQVYHVSAWVKVLQDNPDQNIQMEFDYHFNSKMLFLHQDPFAIIDPKQYWLWIKNCPYFLDIYLLINCREIITFYF